MGGDDGGVKSSRVTWKRSSHCRYAIGSPGTGSSPPSEDVACSFDAYCRHSTEYSGSFSSSTLSQRSYGMRFHTRALPEEWRFESSFLDEPLDLAESRLPTVLRRPSFSAS